MSSNINVENYEGFERFTNHSKNLFYDGFEIAKSNGHKKYMGIHLFFVLLKQHNAIVAEILSRVGIDVQSTVKNVSKEFLKLEKDQKIEFSIEIKKIIQNAFQIASEVSSVYVADEHLLLSLFKTKVEFLDELQTSGIDYKFLRGVLDSFGFNESTDMPFPEAGMYGGPNATKQKSNAKKPDPVSVMPIFMRDMTEEADKGKFGIVTGRDEEINRMIHILSRKTKNNPILVGDAGVGKTAIVEGFVQKLLAGDLPPSFHGKRVISLDVASIISGAKLRGDVEERVQQFVSYVLHHKNIIVFIDEIHQIVGAGSTGGKDSLDIANILKPHLTNSEFIIIGATTSDEYSQYFEDDTALSRRFQPVRVDELDEESAIAVIKNLKKDFENYHRIKINDDAIETAVKLSKTFIQDRYLPDKAIDVLDEASASVRIGREIAIEPELSKFGEELVMAQAVKEEALAQGNLDKAKEYREREESIVGTIENLIEGKIKVQTKYTKTLTSELIKKTLVAMTKIPIAASEITDKQLKDLPRNLKQRIVGQDHVLDKVSLAIQRAHIGLTDLKRPLASFLFLGPTGVGKTRLAKLLAKELFGSEDLIFQIDMSEFMESHAVSKLVGSPPGYVGYQEGGRLTEYVRKKPYSVILFDEIEKAHPDTLNILLQILEEGKITDGKGRTVSMRNTVVVMTSNIGAEDVSEDSRLGFDVMIAEKDAENLNEAFSEMRDKIMEELRYSLRPELINRIDVVEVFRGINEKDSLKITKIEIDELKIRLLQKNLLLNISDSVEAFINKHGYSKEYGGRNIRRKVQEFLENGLAEFLITKKVKRKKNALIKIDVSLNDEKINFTLA